MGRRMEGDEKRGMKERGSEGGGRRGWGTCSRRSESSVLSFAAKPRY